MMETMDCSEARLSLGVYVLGAIDPAERALVDSHLAGCRECRDELAGLAGLPALLARVGTEEVMALAAADGPGAPPVGEAGEVAGEDKAPPRELLSRVLDLTAARRRRRRWREAVLGAAAALIIAAGVFGGVRLASGPAQSPQGSAAVDWGPALGPWDTATGGAQGMVGTVMYRPMGWGTQLSAKVIGIPVGTKCQLWILGSGNHRVMAGSWVTDNREGAVWYPASASIPASDVRAFLITVGKTGSITFNA
jgi:predicted anti-sigma-YlaC factor YlaD